MVANSKRWRLGCGKRSTPATLSKLRGCHGWFRRQPTLTRYSSYLSPEPLLLSPYYISAMAQAGLQVQSFPYAVGNPIRHTDPTGLYIGTGLALCWSDCVNATLRSDEEANQAQPLIYGAALAASNDSCQSVVGEAAVDAVGGESGGVFNSRGMRALNASASVFRIARASGGALAGGSIAAFGACFAHCRSEFAPNGRYRAGGDNNDPRPTGFNPNFAGPKY